MPANVQQLLLSYGAAEQVTEVAFLQTANDTSNTDVYTFSSQSFGAADSERYIIASVFAVAGTISTLSSVTIGGVSATEVVFYEPGANNAYVGIFVAKVPTGTTGDVVVTWAFSMTRCAIALHRALNINATAEDSGNDGGTTGARSVSLSVTSDSVQIASGFNAASTSATWSGTNGVTEDYDELIESLNTFSGGSRHSSSAGTSTNTCTWGSSSTNGIVAASFPKA